MYKLRTACPWGRIVDALGFDHHLGRRDALQGRRRTLCVEPLEQRTLLSLCVWDGGGGDDYWTTAANWAGDVAPVAGDDLRFVGTIRSDTQNDFAVGTSFKSIEFAADHFSLAGNRVALTDGVAVDWGVTGSAISLDTVLDGTITVNVADTNLALSGIISGSGSLTKIGTGTLSLSRNNSYSGGTYLNTGAIHVSLPNDPFGSGTLHLGGGVLHSSGDGTLHNSVEVAHGTTSVIGPFGEYALALAGDISGSGTIRYERDEPGILQLAGENQAFTGVFHEAGGGTTGRVVKFTWLQPPHRVRLRSLGW